MKQMTVTEKMQWNLLNKGFTACLSKASRTKLIKWAEEQGLKVEKDEVLGRPFLMVVEGENDDE